MILSWFTSLVSLPELLLLCLCTMLMFALSAMAVRSHGDSRFRHQTIFTITLMVTVICAMLNCVQARVMRIAGGRSQPRRTRRRRPAGGCSRLQATTPRSLVCQSRWFSTAHPCT